MKSSFQIFISLSLVSLSLAPFDSARAEGGSYGRGGQVIVCTDREVNEEGEAIDPSRGSPRWLSAQSVDYWEWSDVTTSQLPAHHANQAISSIANRTLDRLGRLDRIRSQRFAAIYSELPRKIRWVSNAEMPRTTDANYRLPRPAHCFFIQGAIQFHDHDTGRVTYWFNRDLKDSGVMNNFDWAGLYLHETIYTDFIQNYRSLTSDEVRYYNFMIRLSAFALYHLWTDPSNYNYSMSHLEYSQYLDVLEKAHQPPTVVNHSLRWVKLRSGDLRLGRFEIKKTGDEELTFQKVTEYSSASMSVETPHSLELPIYSSPILIHNGKCDHIVVKKGIIQKAGNLESPNEKNCALRVFGSDLRLEASAIVRSEAGETLTIETTSMPSQRFVTPDGQKIAFDGKLRISSTARETELTCRSASALCSVLLDDGRSRKLLQLQVFESMVLPR